MHDFLSGRSKNATLIRKMDWSDSPMGNPGDWPNTVKTLMNVILGSHQPMFLIWGPQRTLLYNDAYAEILHDRHPAALGQPMLEVWYDIAEQIDPLVRRCYAGEGIHMEHLFLSMIRMGGPVDTYFSFSYTPVREAGTVKGVFCACIETTAEVMTRAAEQAENARTRYLFQQAPGFVAIINGPDHVYEFANQAYMNLIGVKRDVIGRPIREVLHEVHGQGYFEEFDKVLATGKPFISRDARVMLERDESVGLVEVFVDVIFQPVFTNGKPTGIFIEGSDVTDRVHAQEHQKLMIDELNHRVKNTLATVQSIAAHTLRGHPDQGARETFEGRIFALGKAHDVLTAESWSSADLRDVVAQALEPFRRKGLDPFEVNGPVVRLDPRKTLAIAMVLHELATNASKYGALTVPEGLVRVSWDVVGANLDFRWVERGGPVVVSPARRGFGTRLINQTLTLELNGKMTLSYDPEGVTCSAILPLD